MRSLQSVSMRSLGWMLVALLLVSSAQAADAEGVKLPSKEKFHLYLLVGQSNMAGRGKVTDADRVPNPRVLTLTKDRKWVPAVDPIHFDKSVAGVGLGKSFGIAMSEATPGVTIGLIPCAVGGSPIAAWEPGGYHSSTKTHPWDDMLPRAKAALEVGTLKGILWHQGESDARDPQSKVYEEKLHALIARFRKELNAEEVPFVAGQMGKFSDAPWDVHKQTVDAAHQGLVEKVPHCAFVSAEGLNHKGDRVHFDADSYREFGRRYAKAMQALQASQQKETK